MNRLTSHLLSSRTAVIMASSLSKLFSSTRPVRPRNASTIAHHLSALASLEAPLGPTPSEELLVTTLAALRALVFPQLRPNTGSGKALAEQVASGFSILAEQAYKCTGRPIHESAGAVEAFLIRVPSVAARAQLDVRAAFESDPAAIDETEVIACYPGVRSLLVHRFAHELDALGVPLLPRMMAEHAHRETGVDIHPRARIGDSCFVDHGTGVVIGETVVIGNRVRIYQGVTLGAKSFERNADGTMRRGSYKRHPTLEDDVIVYAGATILGGDTVIAKGSVIAGGTFLTESVPPFHVVFGPKPNVELRAIASDSGLRMANGARVKSGSRPASDLNKNKATS